MKCTCIYFCRKFQECFRNMYRFLLRFTGKDEEINLTGDGTEPAEFGEWSWLPPEEIIDRVGTISSTLWFVLFAGSDNWQVLCSSLRPAQGRVPELLHRRTTGTGSYFPVRNSMFLSNILNGLPRHWKDNILTGAEIRNSSAGSFLQAISANIQRIVAYEFPRIRKE